MAIAIKSIPVLNDKVAKEFIDKAQENENKKSTIDYSKQISIASKILTKANK